MMTGFEEFIVLVLVCITLGLSLYASHEGR